MQADDCKRKEKCALQTVAQRCLAGSNDQGGGAEGASQRDRCCHQNAVPHDDSWDAKRCHTRIVHGGNSAADRCPSDRARLQAATRRHAIGEPGQDDCCEKRQQSENEVVSRRPAGAESQHEDEVRGPNAKAAGYRSCSQPYRPSATVCVLSVIEQSNRTVRSECTYKKREHGQSVVMLLCKTVKYPKHGTPLTNLPRLWLAASPR